MSREGHIRCRDHRELKDLMLMYSHPKGIDAYEFVYSE
jgi:hypothetical protein